MYPRHFFHKPKNFIPCSLCAGNVFPDCPECKGSGKTCLNCSNSGSECDCEFSRHYASALEAETFQRQTYAFLSSSPPDVSQPLSAKIRRMFDYPFGIEGKSGILHKKLIFTENPPQIFIWQRIKYLNENTPATFLLYFALPQISEMPVLTEEERRRLHGMSSEKIVLVFLGASDYDVRKHLDLIFKLSARFPNAVIFSDLAFARNAGRQLLAAKVDGV